MQTERVYLGLSSSNNTQRCEQMVDLQRDELGRDVYREKKSPKTDIFNDIFH